MRTLASFPLFALATFVAAQSPLTTFYGGTNQANPGAQFFIDLTVATTITIQAFDVNLSSAVGVEGTLEVYLTVPGTTTYFGSETTPARWSATPVASGPIVAAGANQPSHCCLTPGITLAPGSYGVALRHIDVQPYNTIGTGSPLPGGGGPATNQTYGNAELTVLSGHVQNTPWIRGAAPRAWNGSIHYALGSVPHTCATNASYGLGCYQQQTSFYQFFSGAPAASAALTGRSISMVGTGSGYLVLNNQPGVAFVPPTGAALVLTDDSEVNYAWPSGSPFGAGGPTSLFVHSNGIVSVGGMTGLLPNSYRANVPAFLSASSTAWFSWHDYNPAAGGSGPVRAEEAGGYVLITWDGVESYPTAVINPSTFQLQFQLSTGNVNYVWQSVTSIGQSANGDSHVIGYSPGGPSMDPQPTDLAIFTNVVLGSGDQPGLTLMVDAKPTLGATINYVTSNVTPSAFPVGVLFIALSDVPPFSPTGFDLGIIGAGGCVANVDVNVAPIQAVIFAPGGLSVPLTINNPSFVGNVWYAQSIWLDATVNAFGMLTSNAVKQAVGTF